MILTCFRDGDIRGMGADEAAVLRVLAESPGRERGVCEDIYLGRILRDPSLFRTIATRSSPEPVIISNH